MSKRLRPSWAFFAPDGQAGGNGQAPPPAAPASGSGQAPTTPPANNQPAPSGPPNGQAPTATPDAYTPPTADEWRRHQQELAEARRDAGKYRDELKQRDDANLTAAQKLERDYADSQARALELDARVQQQALELAAHRLAPTLGIADVSVALALVGTEHSGELHTDQKTGNPTNLEALLKRVLADHPVLASGAAQGGPPAGPGTGTPPRPPVSSGAPVNPGRGATPGNWTWDVIGKLTPADYAGLSDAQKAEMTAFIYAHPRPSR